MARKDHHTETSARRNRATGHVHFKHIVKPAKFATVLKAYDITPESFKELQAYIERELKRNSLHAR